MMNLTLTYDHRLVDGAYAGQFLRDLANAAGELGRVATTEPPLGWSSMAGSAYLMNLGLVGYDEAWALQRSLAAAVAQGAIPDTVILLEHPPTITLGRRTRAGRGARPGRASRSRSSRPTAAASRPYHGPGQLVCYPILDLKRHGKDVKRYCRDLEEAIIRTLGAFGVEATRIDGLTGVWLPSPPRKIASIGVHISRWVTTHGYALNVDLDPAPFTDWITACGLEDAAFTSLARETGRPVTVDEVREPAARRSPRSSTSRSTELPGDEPGLWPQPLHDQLAVPAA